MDTKNLIRGGTRVLAKAIILSAKALTRGILFVGKNAAKGTKEALYETSNKS